ncbi:Uncharacterised protein [Mycobacteroides abscessus subsp. bolletii]|nr:Uncharacterised protein [Mycobacteroides abscessus subsp. bolletii]
MLELLRHTVRIGTAVAPQHRDREAQQHPRHRRVHTGGVYQCPGGHRQRHQQPPFPTPTLHRQREQPQRYQGQSQRPPMQLIGIEDRDHDDRQQIVHHRQGEQKGTQRRRQVGRNHREHSECEGDVGGRGNRPAAHRRATAGGVDRQIDGGGDQHAAHGRDDRQRGATGVAQIPGDEFTFEFHSHHEEEDRQQPVGGPAGQGQMQVQLLRPDGDGTQPVVPRAPRRIGPQQRGHCRHHQQDATDGLLAKDLSDTRRLRP